MKTKTGKKPVERNWVNEAFAIAEGDTRIKVNKKHVIAIVGKMAELMQKTNELGARVSKLLSAKPADKNEKVPPVTLVKN